MLQNYTPIYEIALQLGVLRKHAEFLKDISPDISPHDITVSTFQPLLVRIKAACLAAGLPHTSAIAERSASRPTPTTFPLLLSEVDHLNDSLSYELGQEAIFRIPSERKQYFNHAELFGSAVGNVFPSCARDIQRAGSCYALEQEDACVHHLMLVLERGLHALAAKVGLPYQQNAWQVIINDITAKCKTLPRGPDLIFYRQVNAQFEFLKIAYRNHSEHAHDDPYDMEKALSILNHVRTFMQELQKGGLSE